MFNVVPSDSMGVGLIVSGTAEINEEEEDRL